MRNKEGCSFAVLVEVFPDVLVCNCCNHRLELAVNDVVREINETDHMKLFFDKLYSFNWASQKKNNMI
jgi:hypothetical protein